MSPLEIIERELRKFGDLSVRLRPADDFIPRTTFTCFRSGYQSQAGHGDTLEEAYAMHTDKVDALTRRLAA